MSAADILGEIAQVSSMVSVARQLLMSGRTVDLAALEGRMRGLCTAVDGLPVEEGRDLVPSLEALMASLERLDADLQAQHERVCDYDQRSRRR